MIAMLYALRDTTDGCEQMANYGHLAAVVGSDQPAN
jgi:hypothetical protein